MDWQYLAGFFDGEGNIGYHNTPTCIAKRQVWIQISQKERFVLDSIKSFLSSEGIESDIYFNKNKWGGAFLLRLTRPIDVYSFLCQISPLLIVKKEQSELAMRFTQPIAISQKVYEV